MLDRVPRAACRVPRESVYRFDVGSQAHVVRRPFTLHFERGPG
jgi:hypothetical protein